MAVTDPLPEGGAFPYRDQAARTQGMVTDTLASNARERMLMAALMSALAECPHETQENLA